MSFSNWSEVYTQRARQFSNPLDICECYSGGEHYSELWFQETADRIAELLDLRPADRALEVGCGCGNILKRMLARATEFVGVDLSDGVLEVARRELPTVAFHHASAELLPFDDDAFDKAYAHHTVHYFGTLDAVRRAIVQMRRVVRPGGRILLSQVPNADFEAEYQEIRRTRQVQRDERVQHQLRWLWFAPQFFEQLRSDFANVQIFSTIRQSDLASKYRMDVVLTV